MTSLTIRNTLAFLMGFGVALLPSYGPFLGLLFFFGARWHLKPSDLLWLAAALVFALSMGLGEGVPGFFFGALQILAPWLVYKAFRQIRFGRRALAGSSGVGTGLLAGLLVVVVFGWLRIDSFNPYAKTIAQAIVWDSNPSLYGHTVLTLGCLMAILFTDTRLRMASLGLAALGILATGSREAAIAWVIVAVALIFIRYKRTQRTHLVEIALVAAMLALAAGLGPALGWGRLGFLVDLVPAAERTHNLVQGSELAVGDWWDAMGVDVSAAAVVIAGETLTRYTVTKTHLEPWVRLQQVVPIHSGVPYTLSVWIRQMDAASRPGIQSWGQSIGASRPWIVTGVFSGGEWHAFASGSGRVFESGIVAAEGNWQRVWIAFQYEGEEPLLYWHVGLAPDQQAVRGTSAEFAGFQIEQGSFPSDYRPGPATRGLGLSVARFPYWQAAWLGFLEHPLFGWGQGGFAAFFERNWPNHGRLLNTPVHAHNLFLQVLFERGLLGFGGLVLVLAAISQAAFKRRDGAFLAVFAALLIANGFDTTLFYSGVIYPLAAVAGWRAATYRAPSADQADLSRQLSVGLALPLADYFMVVLALALATFSHGLVSGLLGLASEVSFGASWRTLGYAFLLWPAMFWREGLYPGYGLSAPQQLQKQVMGALYAGLIVAAGTLLFTDLLVVSRAVLLLTVLYSMALCPLGRALSKRLLYRVGLWGRPVIILGAGRTGQRIAEALLSRPLEGLHPVAMFDDDASKIGTTVTGLAVQGPIREANPFAERAGLRHVIVAMPRVSRKVLGDLIGSKGRAFKRVQFVPELAGLPSSEVYASSLDEMLALEVRNGLHSESNRTVKRALDFTGGVLSAIFIAPLLAALYLWIRLDSQGPAFYQSERLGQDGKIFLCLKFRSMFVDADERLRDMLAADPARRLEYETYHKLDDDPRITRAGSVMRKYSLDELPQLYNVLAGEMSLVGPRPYLVGELKDMNGYDEAILEAKPGMTGYWQVSGRNEVTFDERLEMEAHYVRNWSIWWDIIILTQTVMVVLSRRGAK
jgi:Undecaprenyl-phosphate galactose phosphotransferase WbaP